MPLGRDSWAGCPRHGREGHGHVTTLAITGPTGRVGMRLIALSHQSDDFRPVAALVRDGHAAMLNRDAGDLAGVGPIGLPITDALPPDVTPDVLIDFTAPAGLRHWLGVCVDRRIPILTGTTGLTDEDAAALDEAAKIHPRPARHQHQSRRRGTHQDRRAKSRNCSATATTSRSSRATTATRPTPPAAPP